MNEQKKETTGLRNSELDNLIKALSPKLFIKIVDACFSGAQYIKSESCSPEDPFRKSIAKHGFKDLYFWHSSREHEPSYAGTDYSRFTESILTAITEHEGDVRYTEIMSSVADDLSNKGMPSPIFITQADHIEKFGMVTSETHNLIYGLFGIDTSDTMKKDHGLATPKVEASIFDLVSHKSEEVCFGEDTILKFISDFNETLVEWDEDFEKLYTVELDRTIQERWLPGADKIGNWLNESQNHKYFAHPTYNEENYTIEEYKALPKKSNSRNATLAIASFWGARDDTDFRLETVTKIRRYIDGFEYTHNSGNRINHIKFIPKKEIADPISIHTVILYSNVSLVVHFSYEFLNRLHWSSYSCPECKDWRILKVTPNSATSAEVAAKHIVKEVKNWLEDSLVKKIEGF